MSMAAMANVSVVVLLFFIIFAILGVQLFSGKFYSCNDASVPDRAACSGTYVDPDTGQVRASPIDGGAVPHVASVPLRPRPIRPFAPHAPPHDACTQVTPRVWSNAAFNFDHLGNAMVSLFVVATLNGYFEIMDAGARSV